MERRSIKDTVIPAWALWSSKLMDSISHTSKGFFTEYGSITMTTPSQIFSIFFLPGQLKIGLQKNSTKHCSLALPRMEAGG